ncbi:MAG: hypothetical protein ABI072_06045 [Edaphobacter sp.]
MTYLIDAFAVLLARAGEFFDRFFWWKKCEVEKADLSGDFAIW